MITSSTVFDIERFGGWVPSRKPPQSPELHDTGFHGAAQTALIQLIRALLAIRAAFHIRMAVVNFREPQRERLHAHAENPFLLSGIWCQRELGGQRCR